MAAPQDILPDDSAFCRQPHPRHRPEREVVFFASRNRTKVKTRSVVSFSQRSEELEYIVAGDQDILLNSKEKFAQ